MDNLQRRQSGIYFARLTVPERLRPVVGQREFIATTGTTQLAVAKIAAGAMLTRWRQRIFDLDRLTAGGGAMNDDSILKIADGHPLLAADSFLPLGQAATVLGLDPAHILRVASEGRLSLFHRFANTLGYVVSSDALEADDVELGTVVVPGPSNMPEGAVRHVATGSIPVAADDVSAVAADLLASGEACVVLFGSPDGQAKHLFIPDEPVNLSAAAVEVSTLQLDHLRRRLSAGITPERLQGARQAQTAARHAVLEAHPSEGVGKRVSDGVNVFMKDRAARSSPEHARRVRAACDLFTELMGDPLAREVNRTMMRRFKEQVLPTVPARENQLRAKHATKTVTQSIAVAKATGWPSLSKAEQDKRLGWFGECVTWMAREGWLIGNPMDKLVVSSARGGSRDQDRRAAFSVDNLRVVFSAVWFATGKGVMTRQGTYREYLPSYFWLPALGLFTGARINELCQLDLADIRQSPTGVWFISINDDGQGKSLKNANSKRLIPLHPTLITWGLLKWRERLMSRGEVRLFPELRHDPAKGYSKDAVKWFSRFLLAGGIPRDGMLVFHSFRHTFATACLNRLHLPEPIVAQLTGHARGASVLSATYRKDAPPDEVVEAVSRLAFELPPVVPFDVDAGEQALQDAMRRKNGGRGATAP